MSINFEEECFDETIDKIVGSQLNFVTCGANLVLVFCIFFWSGFGFSPLPRVKTNYHYAVPLVWFWLCPLPQARTFSNLRPFCHISGLVLALSITRSKDQSFWYAAGLVWFCQSTPDNSFLPFGHTLNRNLSPFLSNFLCPVSVFEID